MISLLEICGWLHFLWQLFCGSAHHLVTEFQRYPQGSKKLGASDLEQQYLLHDLWWTKSTITIIEKSHVNTGSPMCPPHWIHDNILRLYFYPWHKEAHNLLIPQSLAWQCFKVGATSLLQTLPSNAFPLKHGVGAELRNSARWHIKEDPHLAPERSVIYVVTRGLKQPPTDPNCISKELGDLVMQYLA